MGPEAARFSETPYLKKIRQRVIELDTCYPSEAYMGTYIHTRGHPTHTQTHTVKWL